jgi:hypothetical protein
MPPVTPVPTGARALAVPASAHGQRADAWALRPPAPALLRHLVSLAAAAASVSQRLEPEQLASPVGRTSAWRPARHLGRIPHRGQVAGDAPRILDDGQQPHGCLAGRTRWGRGVRWSSRRMDLPHQRPQGRLFLGGGLEPAREHRFGTTTSVWPRLTGMPSAIAKARSLDASQSACGRSRNGDPAVTLRLLPAGARSRRGRPRTPSPWAALWRPDRGRQERCGGHPAQPKQ